MRLNSFARSNREEEKREDKVALWLRFQTAKGTLLRHGEATGQATTFAELVL